MTVEVNSNDRPLATNKEEGLERCITATGREIGAVPVVGTSLWRVALVDGLHGGQIPAKYSGRYTSYKEACFARDTFVQETWEVAASHTKKRKSVAA